MKKSRYSEEQIIGIFKEVGGGMTIVEVCHKYWISDGSTYYNWKAKYNGMTVSEAKRLIQLEDENRRLKQIVADLTLDNQELKAVSAKNF